MNDRSFIEQCAKMLSRGAGVAPLRWTMRPERRTHRGEKFEKEEMDPGRRFSVLR